MGVYRGYGSGPAAGQTYEEWLRAFSETFLGSSAVAPTVDLYGNPIQYGAQYFNTVDEILYVYTSSGWVAVGDNTTAVAGGAGGMVTINNLLADTAYSLASNSNMMMQNLPLYTSALSFYTFTADRLIWVPLVVARDTTLRYLMLGWYDYYDGVANISARFYIHKGDATGYGGPGTMLYDSGSFEPGIFGGGSPAIQKFDAWRQEITGGLAVTAGTTYWVGVVCSSAAYKVAAASLNSENASFGWNKSDDNAAYKTIYKAAVGTVTTAGSSPGVSLATTDKTVNVPIFYFQTV